MKMTTNINKIFTFIITIILTTSCTIETDNELNWIRDIKGAQMNDQQEPELMAYLTEFVDEAKTRGVDLSYVYDHNIQIRFSSTVRTGVAGVSYGLGDDKAINILISESNWERFNKKNCDDCKKYLLFHELAHDILNQDHGQNVIMTTPHSKRLEKQEELGYTWEDVLDEMY